MVQENGKITLSFSERVAKAKQEAEDKAKQQAESSVSSAKFPEPKQSNQLSNIIYFYSSIDSFRFIIAPGRKDNFKNHFYVTDDPVAIETIRKDFVSKISGHVHVTEVSEYFYQASRMIQPDILPLPAQTEELSLAQQEKKLDNS